MTARNRFALLTILTLALALPLTAFAQRPGGRPGMERRGNAVVGTVVDRDLNQPIYYATVILYDSEDSTQVNGATSDRDGTFRVTNVPPGRYYARIAFIGYQSATRDSIRVSPGAGAVSLGEIALRQAALEMDDVNYVIEQSPVEYRIDKKVVHVDKQATSASGTATDILENVPSVQVDIDGNVQLRGSGNFRVLIDGRPTVLDANDALQQIPAASIDNLEIITNPSAKYDPEGTAGIINIVMRKERRRGHSAMVSVDGGYPERYGFDALYQRRLEHFNLTLGGDYNVRSMPGTRDIYTRTTSGGVTTFTDAAGEGHRGRDSWDFRASVDGDLGKADWLSVGGRFGGHSGGRESEIDYIVNVDTLATVFNRYTSDSDRERSELFGTAYTEWRHTYGGQRGHELSARAQVSWEDGDEETIEKLLAPDGSISSGRVSTEAGPSIEYDLRTDYVRPIHEGSRFEAGYRMQHDASEEETSQSEYDDTVGDFVIQPQYSRTVNYRRTVHALYGIYSDQWGSLGAQFGLRGEYTDRSVELQATGREYTVDRPDVFPTLHTSYEWAKGYEAMASYSRRIHRPRGWFLEPFETWMDAYNVRRGNPNLDPEYIDSYEIGYQMPLGPFHHSTELYHRVTHNEIEFLRSVYQPGVALMQPENVGTSSSTGLEVMFNGDLVAWLNANLMGNFYQASIENSTGGINEDFSWSTRLALTFDLTERFKLRTNGFYNSPVVSSQGKREEFYMVNAALEGKFFNETLTAILQVRDVLDTAEFSRITEAPGLYSEMFFDRKGPFVALTLRWNYNNFRMRRDRFDGNGGDMEDGGDEFMG